MPGIQVVRRAAHKFGGEVIAELRRQAHILKDAELKAQARKAVDAVGGARKALVAPAEAAVLMARREHIAVREIKEGVEPAFAPEQSVLRAGADPEIAVMDIAAGAVLYAGGAGIAGAVVGVGGQGPEANPVFGVAEEEAVH